MKLLLFVLLLALTGCVTTKPYSSLADDKTIYIVPEPKNCNLLKAKRLLHPRFYNKCRTLQRKGKAFRKKYLQLYTHHEAPNYQLLNDYNNSVKDCEERRNKIKRKEAKRGFIYDPAGPSCSDSIKNDPFLRHYRNKLIHQGFEQRLA